MRQLCICVSLEPEAQPIIQQYRLEKMPHKGISVYANDKMLLVKTGVGKKSIKRALAQISNLEPQLDAFLNIGIAGGTAALGTPQLAHTIIDNGSNRPLYPHLPPRRTSPTLDTTTVRTVSEPQTQYLEAEVFDMEASEFFQMASIRTHSSRIQSLKIISDGPENRLSSITPTLTRELIHQSLSPISSLVEYLINTSTETKIELNDVLQPLFHRVRHSVTEQHRLRRLCVRLCALTETRSLDPNWFESERQTTAGQLALNLEKRLNTLVPRYEAS